MFSFHESQNSPIRILGFQQHWPICGGKTQELLTPLTKLEEWKKSSTFVRELMLKTDREMHSTIYSDIDFTSKDESRLINLFLKHSHQLEKLSEITQKVFEALGKKCGLNNSEYESLIASVTDPACPLPDISRSENLSSHCFTAFQSYLSREAISPREKIPANFARAYNFFVEKEESYLRQILSSRQKDGKYSNGQQAEPFSSLLLYPENVTHLNYENWMTEENQLQNLIVLLLAITDLHLKAISLYSESIEGQFGVLIDYNLKCNIFKAYVLQIEESLAFAFRIYNEFCYDIYGTRRQNFSFWKISLAKFRICMQQIDSKCNLTFARYFLSDNGLASLTLEKDHQIQEYYIREESEQSYFVSEYVGSKIDVSLGEVSALFIGHSKLQLNDFYKNFETQILSDQNQNLQNLFQKLETAKINASLLMKVLDQMNGDETFEAKKQAILEEDEAIVERVNRLKEHQKNPKEAMQDTVADERMSTKDSLSSSQLSQLSQLNEEDSFDYYSEGEEESAMECECE